MWISSVYDALLPVALSFFLCFDAVGWAIGRHLASKNVPLTTWVLLENNRRKKTEGNWIIQVHLLENCHYKGGVGDDDGGGGGSEIY